MATSAQKPHKTKLKIRFNDPAMQRHYATLISSGYHWKAAERKTIQIFQEYDAK
jgi:hypothetical protein